MKPLEKITSLKNRLNKLKEHKIDQVKINNAVKFSGVEAKRELEIRKILDALDQLDRVKQKQDRWGIMPEVNTLVLGEVKKMRDGVVTKRMIPTFVNNELVKAFDKEKDLNFLYADSFRLTPLTTLKERAAICIQQMNLGELDDILDTDPYQVLSHLMGINGELLPRLNIDPIEYISPEHLEKIKRPDQETR